MSTRLSNTNSTCDNKFKQSDFVKKQRKMAFKEIGLFSTLMVITVINFNALESEAMTIDSLNNDYLNVQKGLYQLQQSEFNLMNDSQKLYDIMKEYLSGRVDKSALEAAQAELLKSKADWYQKAMKYLYDTTNFEPASNYPFGPLSNLYPNTALPPSLAPVNPLGDTDIHIYT